MTVAELIEKLRAMPHDASVLVLEEEFSTLHPPRIAHSAARNAVVMRADDSEGACLRDSEYEDLFMGRGGM